MCQSLCFGLCATGHHSAQTGTEGKEACCLTAYDVEVNSFRQNLGVLTVELQKFAIGERLSELRDVAYDAHILGLCCTLQCLAQHEVACQHRYLIGEECVDGRQTAPAVAFINHIIMDERGRMQHLEGEGYADDLLVHLAYHA